MNNRQLENKSNTPTRDLLLYYLKKKKLSVCQKVRKSPNGKRPFLEKKKIEISMNEVSSQLPSVILTICISFICLIVVITFELDLSDFNS